MLMGEDANKRTDGRRAFRCEVMADDPVRLILAGDIGVSDVEWIIDAAIEAIDSARCSATQNLVIDVRAATFRWGGEHRSALDEAIRLCADAGVHLTFDRRPAPSRAAPATRL